MVYATVNRTGAWTTAVVFIDCETGCKMAGPNPSVINWEEALVQCGDDEEFLHELLGDFRSELETQLSNIAATIQVCRHR